CLELATAKGQKQATDKFKKCNINFESIFDVKRLQKRFLESDNF
ncbi:1685_t:CDS:2, partial [Racocetra persica]